MKQVLKKFEPFRELWDNDRELKYEVDNCISLTAVKWGQNIIAVHLTVLFVKEFMGKKPSLLEMESDIQHYDCIEIMIDKIESLIILESIELSTGKELIICTLFGFNMYFMSCVHFVCSFFKVN